MEAMRNIVFDVCNDLLLMYRTMTIKAELKRRKAIADCQDRKTNHRKINRLLLDQRQSDYQIDNHDGITVEDDYFLAGNPTTWMYYCHRLEMRQVFDLFDENKDGFISADELRQYMKKLGVELSDHTVKDMVESVDSNNDNCLDFEEFYSLYNSLCGGGQNSTNGDKQCSIVREEDDEEGNLIKAFFVFDENKDGLISVLELQQVLLKLGLPEGNSLMSCERMIRRVDADGNGKVDFFEFKDMMCSNDFSFCSS